MAGSGKIAIAIVSSEQHVLQGHPERPARFQHFDALLGSPLGSSLQVLEPTPASLDVLNEVHPGSYLREIQAASRRGPGFVDYGDTYVTGASYEAALSAAGGALTVTDSVIQSDFDAGFALIRPPGHHASETKAGGFCLLNNIAIAARQAQSMGLGKVMIIDFDVHHGNGTEAIFFEDAQVLYLSTHQWGIYPGTGSLNAIGSGHGEGTIVNVPLPAGAGDQAFERIGEQIIVPIAERFRPDLLLVSAGFDAHWRDPLASLQLTIPDIINWPHCSSDSPRTCVQVGSPAFSRGATTRKSSIGELKASSKHVRGLCLIRIHSGPRRIQSLISKALSIRFGKSMRFSPLWQPRPTAAGEEEPSQACSAAESWLERPSSCTKHLTESYCTRRPCNDRNLVARLYTRYR